LSLDITDKQWSNPEHRKNISEKASKQLLREYENGIRDKKQTTKKANEKTRELIKEGKFHLNTPEAIERTKLVTNTPAMRKASSERMKRNNPMNDPIIAKKARESLIDLYENHPEKRLNARMAKLRKSGKKTYIEQRMANLLDELSVEYIFQYPILRYNADFAIPDLKIVIECDGEYWHKDKEADLKRQKRIENEGWTVLRFTGSEINKKIEEVKLEIIRVLYNHTGQYEFTDWKIESLEKYIPKKKVTLYNFSVMFHTILVNIF
jgi:very-short-patch-repair endonuclease